MSNMKPVLAMAAMVASAVLLAACGSQATEPTAEPPSPQVDSSPQPSLTDPPPPSETAMEPTRTPTAETGGQKMALLLTSSAFEHQGQIPPRFTCDGEDISPPLAWEQAPSGTVAYALIVDDPDAPAGTWDHWVLYNLPGSAVNLNEGVPPQEVLDSGALHGRNSWRDLGYGGPCPPDGTHRYFFRLYALDSPLDLEAGASKQELLDAMQGHILGQAELMGTYTR